MTNSWTLTLLVGIGGFAGSIARYRLSVFSQQLTFEWPVGTFGANLLGCLFIGIITGLVARTGSISPEARLALATGFCGGFTTMSSMIYETAEMARASEYLHAAAYAIGTFLLSVLAYFSGLFSARLLFKLGGSLWN